MLLKQTVVASSPCPVHRKPDIPIKSAPHYIPHQTHVTPAAATADVLPGYTAAIPPAAHSYHPTHPPFQGHSSSSHYVTSLCIVLPGLSWRINFTILQGPANHFFSLESNLQSNRPFDSFSKRIGGIPCKP